MPAAGKHLGAAPGRPSKAAGKVECPLFLPPGKVECPLFLPSPFSAPEALRKPCQARQKGPSEAILRQKAPPQGAGWGALGG